MAALNQIIGDIRRYIFDLRAAEQSSELETVLETLVQDLRLDTLLEVDLEVTGRRCCVLSDQKIAHFTQVAREALSNVAQHAEASRVWVNLDYRGKTTCLTVSDDGRGLGSPEERSHDGHGLTNMQARQDAGGAAAGKPAGGWAEAHLGGALWPGRRSSDRGSRQLGMALRILLVDDHEVVRVGIRSSSSDSGAWKWWARRARCARR